MHLHSTGNIAAALLLSMMSWHVHAVQYPFQDTSLSFDVRASNLVSLLTTEEKISQLGSCAPAIPRLGIKNYFYWREAIHGVMDDFATIFPQVIGLSSTWDTALIYNIADVISSEARALSSQPQKDLVYFAPNINMARDPRWGRNEETYGEDVFLTKKMAINYIKGLQGNDTKYLKTIATAKHFACNNIENNRYRISSEVDERSLREYFLPVFKAAVTEANVGSIMSAYNALNGVPCTANPWLLNTLLRKEWGFKGFVVSDCLAIEYLYSSRLYVYTRPQAAALALSAGCDLSCGTTYQQFLPVALATKTWSFEKSLIDTSLKRIFRARFLLGEFDPRERVPFASIPQSILGCREHRDLALKAARESIVLLKNSGALPLDTSRINSIAVIGPNANVSRLGGYSSSIPTNYITPFRGIINAVGTKNRKITYIRGCSTMGPQDPIEFDHAINAAANADVAIVFVGTDQTCVGEDNDLSFSGLPGVQGKLVESVYSANPNTIVVLINGNPLPISWINTHVPAIIESWFGGPDQGAAIADVLFGTYNPGGKLTQTWVSNENSLPAMNDYNIFNNRTYMYFTGQPMYPFGFGLSYTSFSYANLTMTPSVLHPGDTLRTTVDITNVGKRAGDEILQLYIHDRVASVKVASKQLKGFCRTNLEPGETKTVEFRVPYDELSFWDIKTHSFVVEPGEFDIMVGASSADIRLSGVVTATGVSRPDNSQRLVKLISTNHRGQSNYRLMSNTAGPYNIALLRPDGKVIFEKRQVCSTNCPFPALTPGIYIVKITGFGKANFMKIVVGQ
jgi:beta-glucosidase